MKILLYVNSAETNRLDKTPFLQEVGVLDGSLRAPTNIVNPDILVQLPTEPAGVLADADGEIVTDSDGAELIGESDALKVFNYAYIPEFRRYYYLNNIRAEVTGVYTISLSSDPLMSFRAYLLNLSALIARNEYDYNGKAEDSLMPFELSEDVSYSIPPSIAPNGALTKLSADFNDRRNFLLNVINKENASPASYIAAPQGTPLPDIAGNSFSVLSSSAYALSPQGVKSLGRAMIDDDTLVSFVKSLIAFPFDIPHVVPSGVSSIYFGNTPVNLGGVTALPSWGLISPYIEVMRFTFPEVTEYDGFSPFSHYELFVPFLGYVELDARLLSGHDISVYYAPNYEDGSADAYIFDMTTQAPVHVASCQLGIKLSFDSTNNREITNQRNAMILNGVVGALASGLSVGVGIATLNPLAIGGGVINLGRTLAETFNKNAMLYERAQVGFSSGVNSLYSPLTPFLRIRRKKRLINDMDAYRRHYGQPLQEFRPLSSISGFTTIAAIHLEGIPAMQPEIASLEGMLQNGVIF